ncbi:MAG TPA: protoporphyrinogen oxidase HemJ [Hyphomicrobiales bacterium]|nr:protoporphyrinogen oxidase HemJ [Hyphomicrobiales bacterium]
MLNSLVQWLLFLHLFSLIAFMAAMFYLPRLFVYHAGVPLDSEQAKTFQVMERRLIRGIANPALIATWVFGILLAWQTGLYQAHWLHAKIALVLLLSAFHGLCSVWRRHLADGTSTKTPRFFRMVNEIPTVLLIGILFLVVLQPF